MKFKSIFIVIAAFLLLSGYISEAAKPPKASKPPASRGVDACTTGTNSIDIAIGDGYGYIEEIINRSFAFHPASQNDWYQIYLGFFGVTFGDDSGEVHQSRYIATGIHADGEIAVIDTMGTETGIEIIGSDTLNSISGKMGDNTMALENGDLVYFVIGNPITVGTVSIEIVQKLILRENTDDQFFFLEYSITNLDSVFITAEYPEFGYFDSLVTRPLLNGKILFFADIDAGNGANDNYTGIDSSRNLIYQYAEGETYCGFAPVLREHGISFGNYNNWYDYGTDAKIDTMVKNPSYNSSWENIPGDLSSYLVIDMPNLAPLYEQEPVPSPQSYNPRVPPDPYYQALYDDPKVLKLTYVFALGSDLQDLQAQIDQAKQIYDDNPIFTTEANSNYFPEDFELLSLHPNPFNSVASITLSLNGSSRGSVRIFDILGREVNTLHSGYLPPGMHDFKWNGITNAGSGAAAGIYFVRAKYGDFEETKKLIYLP